MFIFNILNMFTKAYPQLQKYVLQFFLSIVVQISKFLRNNQYHPVKHIHLYSQYALKLFI